MTITITPLCLLMLYTAGIVFGCWLAFQGPRYWSAFGYPEREMRLDGCMLALVSACAFLVVLGYIIARWIT